MKTIDEIEQTIRGLAPPDLAERREWFAAFDAEIWMASSTREFRLLKKSPPEETPSPICTNLLGNRPDRAVENPLAKVA
jgi:hypothetical protein